MSTTTLAPVQMGCFSLNTATGIFPCGQRQSVQSRALASNNWRRTGSTPTPTPTPTPAQVPAKPQCVSPEVGKIYFLPAAHHCTGSRINSQLAQANNQQAYEHPCVVLKTKVENGVELVLIRIGTSVGGYGISAKKAQYRAEHLLVEDGCTQPLRRVSGSDTFGKATYINWQLDQMYEIEASCLWEWMGARRSITLDQEAVYTLLGMGWNSEITGFTPQEICQAAWDAYYAAHP
ncbi:hypothetical protein BDV96DRAFT_597528 [Lophiotrema nucula]|uniref:Uncharacterized protein n=1 Tax=Lophiotrema nucula TaxID=690887 RepID=A0A6A5ZDJ7_9PLEO|nr:hypothetical protein BDV96DRAFT_597528 [Lophiotrema nucula]